MWKRTGSLITTLIQSWAESKIIDSYSAPVPKIKKPTPLRIKLYLFCLGYRKPFNQKCYLWNIQTRSHFAKKFLNPDPLQHPIKTLGYPLLIRYVPSSGVWQSRVRSGYLKNFIKSGGDLDSIRNKKLDSGQIRIKINKKIGYWISLILAK